MTPNKEAALRDLRHCIAVASLEQPGWRSTWEQALSDITTPDALTEAVGLLRDLVSWFSEPTYGAVWIIRAGDQGADDAVNAAQAFLSRHEAERKGP